MQFSLTKYAPHGERLDPPVSVFLQISMPIGISIKQVNTCTQKATDMYTRSLDTIGRPHHSIAASLFHSSLYSLAGTGEGGDATPVAVF